MARCLALALALAAAGAALAQEGHKVEAQLVAPWPSSPYSPLQEAR